jgi:transposase
LPAERDAIVKAVKSGRPVNYGLPGHGWTLKKLCCWVESVLERKVSRNTLRQILKAAGLSWKKCKKLLSKANPEKRAAFVEQFQHLFERMCQGQVRIIYVDESHFHQDLDLGYTWAPVGKPLWRKSVCPPLSARINWYGAYDFTEGRVFIWHEGKCNSEHTVQFLQRLRQWIDDSKRQLVIIWDGAPWHRSQIARTQAELLDMQVIQLPGYSPDLNPIEALWKWMREEVTQHYCHLSLHDLFTDCLAFIERINCDPDAMVSRLWPKFDLDPDFEKLLLSG